MASFDETYFRRRAAAEADAALRADDPAVASVHTELARRYRALIDAKLPAVLQQVEDR